MQIFSDLENTCADNNLLSIYRLHKIVTQFTILTLNFNIFDFKVDKSCSAAGGSSFRTRLFFVLVIQSYYEGNSACF